MVWAGLLFACMQAGELMTQGRPLRCQGTVDTEQEVQGRLRGAGIINAAAASLCKSKRHCVEDKTALPSDTPC